MNASNINEYPEVQSPNMLSGVDRQVLQEPVLIFQIQYRGDLFVLIGGIIRYQTDKISDVMLFFSLPVV